MAKTIYVLNGPNLNLLGTREPQIYGRSTLKDVEKLCAKTAAAHGLDDRIPPVEPRGRDRRLDSGGRRQQGRSASCSIPAASPTPRLSVHDAIKGVRVPVIEMHISNIHAREPWRNHSYVSFAAKAVICGFGIQGYALAIDGLAAMSGNREAPSADHDAP